MTIKPSMPTALYKANPNLTLHLGRLMQNSQARWAGFLQQQAQAAITPFAVTRNVQPLTALRRGEWPANGFWTRQQGSTRPWQATMATALENPAAFADVPREAISTWQRECSAALQTAPDGMPLGASLNAMTDLSAARSDAPAARHPASAQGPRT